MKAPQSETRYFFALKEEEEKATLSGVENVMNEKMIQQRKAWEFEQLQKEHEELKEEMDEQETYIEKLEGMLQEEKGKKASLKDNWGEVVGVALEGMVRRNSHLLGGIPMIGQGLAGVIEEDNKRWGSPVQNSPTPNQFESNVTFKKVSNPETDQAAVRETLFKSALTKEDEQTLNYFTSLRTHFTESELDQLFEIIGRLSHDKENLSDVLELLRDESEEGDDELPGINNDGRQNVHSVEPPIGKFFQTTTERNEMQDLLAAQNKS